MRTLSNFYQVREGDTRCHLATPWCSRSTVVRPGCPGVIVHRGYFEIFIVTKGISIGYGSQDLMTRCPRSPHSL